MEKEDEGIPVPADHSLRYTGVDVDLSEAVFDLEMKKSKKIKMRWKKKTNQAFVNLAFILSLIVGMALGWVARLSAW